MIKNKVSKEELAIIRTPLIDKVIDNLIQVEADFRILLFNKEIFEADNDVFNSKVVELLDYLRLVEDLSKLSEELFKIYKKKH